MCEKPKCPNFVHKEGTCCDYTCPGNYVDILYALILFIPLWLFSALLNIFFTKRITPLLKAKNPDFYLLFLYF